MPLFATEIREKIVLVSERYRHLLVLIIYFPTVYEDKGKVSEL